MSQFTFIVDVSTDEGNEEYASILLEADAWDEIANSKQYVGDEIQILMLKRILSTAYAMYGYAFDMQRFSPRQLYEALTSERMKFSVTGNVPSNLID